jgi:hypothetical protein
MFVCSTIPILVSSLDDENEDENTPLPTHLPPDEFFVPESTPVPQLARWVHST